MAVKMSGGRGLVGRPRTAVPPLFGQLPATLAAAATAITTTATAAAEASAPTCAATTRPAFLGLLDLKTTAVDFLTIELRDGRFGLFGRSHLHEPEAAGAARIAIGHHGGRIDLT